MCSSSLVIQGGSKSNHKGLHTAQTEDNVKTAVKNGVNVATGKSAATRSWKKQATVSLTRASVGEAHVSTRCIQTSWYVK